MKNNYIAWLIAASALGILALIGFQVSWMRHSRMLLEEQFNNRVNMALCSTVEKLAANPDHSDEVKACCAQPSASACNKNFEALLKQPEMESALTEALQFYQIDLPYRLAITPKDSNNALPKYSCSLGPILESDTHLLSVEFQGKTEYFLKQMGLMLVSSITILAFICVIFGIASLYLLRQKRLSDRNRDFFNHMTHEFRTPLTNIRLASSLLLRKNQELAGNDYLGIIRRECDQLTHQVENVLQLASLEKGDYQLQKQSLNLHQLAEEVVSGMALQIRESEGRVELAPRDADSTLIGDPFHLGNAFRNILDNALKYSGPRPMVQIGIESVPTGWRIRFTDNGGGLPAQDRRKIFKKFHRCDNALCSGKKGFGLGLAYVKKIVDLHKGQVSVFNAAGKGACFEVFLPNTADAPAAAPHPVPNTQAV